MFIPLFVLVENTGLQELSSSIWHGVQCSMRLTVPQDCAEARVHKCPRNGLMGTLTLHSDFPPSGSDIQDSALILRTPVQPFLR